ncbi:MAG: flavodoxin [Oscillospiraceae bacterium]|nr:flavodoxin [Oscillospiraceae bacterium]
MRIAIRYYTQTGNTRKLAEAIAAELGVEAKPVSAALEEKTDIVFLCNSVYWAGIDKSVKRFVRDNADKIGMLVNVSTAALIASTYAQMQKTAADAGVKLCAQEYHCRGSFAALHAGHPNEAELDAVKAFARGLWNEPPERPL